MLQEVEAVTDYKVGSTDFPAQKSRQEYSAGNVAILAEIHRSSWSAELECLNDGLKVCSKAFC